MPSEDVSLRTLTDSGDPALADVPRIYVDALPDGDRKPVAWLATVCGPDRRYRFMVAERGTVVVGFAILFVPADAGDAALLEYLAVADTARGTGVGTRLARRCLSLATGPLLVEIDTADPDAGRRRAFYERLGFRAVIGLQYKLPLPGAGPMGLMVAGTAAAGRVKLRRWISAIYNEVYGQDRDDPRIADMVGGLEESADEGQP